MKDFTASVILDRLWNWVTTFKNRELVKDTSNIHCVKFDGYINSTLADPLSFTVFEMSDNGELLIDSVNRIMESEAAFFLFVNTKAGWITAVKNTPENVKKLIKREPLQNLKIKIIE